MGFNSEINYLFLFLTSQEIVSLKKLPLTDDLETKIDKVNRHLLNTVNKNNHDELTKLTTAELDSLADSIRSCERSSLIFDVTPISFEDTESMKKLTHLFPLAKQITETICKIILNYLKLQPSTVEYDHLVINFMLSIITVLPKRLSSLPVHIVIDFSAHSSFHKSVVQYLEGMHNISFDNKLSSSTDIYLTDHYTKKIPTEAHQVVWSIPLTENDYEELQQAIIEIQLKKLTSNS